jgi:hypothetical protein
LYNISGTQKYIYLSVLQIYNTSLSKYLISWRHCKNIAASSLYTFVAASEILRLKILSQLHLNTQLPKKLTRFGCHTCSSTVPGSSWSRRYCRRRLHQTCIMIQPELVSFLRKENYQDYCYPRTRQCKERKIEKEREEWVQPYQRNIGSFKDDTWIWLKDTSNQRPANNEIYWPNTLFHIYGCQEKYKTLSDICF